MGVNEYTRGTPLTPTTKAESKHTGGSVAVADGTLELCQTVTHVLANLQ